MVTKVAIVEDQAAIAESTSRSAEDAGYATVVIPSPQTAAIEIRSSLTRTLSC